MFIIADLQGDARDCFMEIFYHLMNTMRSKLKKIRACDKIDSRILRQIKMCQYVLYKEVS